MAQELGVSPALTMGSRLATIPDLLASDLAGEMVLLNLADGVYYGLDMVGAYVWRLLGARCTVRAIVDDVVAHFDVEPARCEHDVLTFLGDLHAHGLVTVVAAGDG